MTVLIYNTTRFAVQCDYPDCTHTHDDNNRGNGLNSLAELARHGWRFDDRNHICPCHREPATS